MNEKQFEKMNLYDKLDYRKTIAKLLENCYYSLGTGQLSNNVKRLIFSVETMFPGLDLSTPINKRRKELLTWYDSEIEKLQGNREVWCHPLLQGVHVDMLNEQYWEALLSYVRDILAIHRGLWFGINHPPGGTQLGEDKNE